MNDVDRLANGAMTVSAGRARGRLITSFTGSPIMANPPPLELDNTSRQQASLILVR